MGNDVEVIVNTALTSIVKVAVTVVFATEVAVIVALVLVERTFGAT